MLNKLVPSYGIILGIIMLLIGIKNFKSISRKRKFNYVNGTLEIILLGIGILFVHTSFY
jgi:hypothetical protein